MEYQVVLYLLLPMVAAFNECESHVICDPAEGFVAIPCGCGDLVLEGEVVMEDDNGLQLLCTDPQPSFAGGNTTISEDTECILLCDGVPAWDLYCSQGEWSEQLTSAKDVRCYGGGGGVTLSTWFKP